MNNYNEQNNNHTSYTSPGPGPQNGGRPPRSDNFWDGISWGVDIALIFLWFPVGLGLTIAHGLGVDIVGKIIAAFRGHGSKRAGAQWMPDESQRSYKGTGAGTQKEEPPRTEKKAAEAKTAPKTEARAENVPAQPGIRRPEAGATAKTVFGWLLAAFGVVGAIASAGAGVWAVLTWAAVALGGGSLLLSAATGRRKGARFKSCMTVSGSEGIVDIGRLARTMGWKGTEADRNLSEMIDRGYYGERAYIDHERGLLVIRPEAMRDVYRAEDMAAAARKAQAEQEAARAAQTAGVSEDYARILEEIRQADIDIDDEAMSEKIRRMQTITAAIFKEVEAHPEKRKDISRFMNYYLPTTLKLLKNYARIEEQGVTGRNMAKAKADIERIADTLVEGYEKQLDTLYRAEAMDIAGDVSVIENMMKRDGLTGAKDFSSAPGQNQTMGGH